jgi:hypothetical protein
VNDNGLDQNGLRGVWVGKIVLQVDSESKSGGVKAHPEASIEMEVNYGYSARTETQYINDTASAAP